MRYRRLIVLSTILAFMLIVCLCLVWLFKVSETEISVTGKDTGDVYVSADKALENVALGKNILFLSTDEIKAELEKDPYVEVKNVEKVFPSKIKAAILKREERFAYFDGGSYYYADENFVYLKKSDVLSGDNVIKVEVTGKEFDFDGSTLGKPFPFSSDDILGYAEVITESIPDKFNIVAEISVDGEKNRLYFKTVTGTNLEFRFNYGNKSPTEEEKRAAGKAICEKTSAVVECYYSLGEAEKSSGSVLCYVTDNFSVIVEYDGPTEDEAYE